MASGDIHLSAAPTMPAGRLPCDGSAVSRMTYANLFTTIGITYGTGDGSTTFNVPNLIERIPIGCGGRFTLGLQSGSQEHYIGVENLPQHTHTVGPFAPSGATGGGGYDYSGAPGGVYLTTDGGNGSGLPLTTMPPTLALNWQIEV